MRAVAESSNRIRVSWTAASSGGVAANWQVRRGTSGGWINKSAGTLFHVFSGLAASTGYTFQVRGRNSVGNGAVGQASATTQAVQPPARPSVSTTGVTHNFIRVRWTPGSGGGPVSYWQISSTGRGGSWTNISGGAATRSFGIANRRPSTTYTYYVRGVTGDGVPGLIGQTRVTTRAAPVAVPHRPSATARAVSDTSIRLSWSAAATGGRPTRWEVRTTREGTWRRVSASTFSYLFTGLDAQSTYTLQVRGVNSGGNGAAASVSATTLAAPAPTVTQGPRRPTVSVDTITHNTVRLRWTPRSGGTPAVSWQWSFTGVGDWTNISGGAAARQTPITGLTPETDYTIYVRGVAAQANLYGAVGQSSFTTLAAPSGNTAPPAAPTVSATALTSSSVEVRWQPQGANAASSWQLRTGTGPWFSYTANIRSEVVAGLSPSTAYRFQVRGVNDRGTGPAGTANATTLSTTVELPAAPVVSAGRISSTSAEISWTAGSGGGTVAGWQISRDGARWTNVPGGAARTAYTLTGLASSTTYTAYVRGVTADDILGPAGTATFTTTAAGTTVPATPGSTTAPPAVIVRDVPRVVWQGPLRRNADVYQPLLLEWNYNDPETSQQANAYVRRVITGSANPAYDGTTYLVIPTGGAAPNWSSQRQVIRPPGFAYTTNRVEIPGKPVNTTAVDLTNTWGDSDNFVGDISFQVEVIAVGAGNRTSLPSTPLQVTAYTGLRLAGLEQFNPNIPNIANLPAFRWYWWNAGVTNADRNAARNTAVEYKIAVYADDDLARNPLALPRAGSIREPGQTMSPTGAHWAPTGYDINSVSNTYNTIFTGRLDDFPSATQGLLPDGNYTVRVRIRDLYGNIVGPATLNVRITRPPSTRGTTVPRVYQADDTIVGGLSGLLRGDYVGLNWVPTSAVADRDGFAVTGGEGGILLFERREFDAGPLRPADLTPRAASGRITLHSATVDPSGVGWRPQPDSVLFEDDEGRHVIFRDRQVEPGVEYEYRVLLVNRYGNVYRGPWVPA